MDEKDIKELKYWTIIVLLTFIPTIGFHLLMRPLWFKGVESSTSASVFGLLFTIIILPIYLVFINYVFSKRFKKTRVLFLINGLLMLPCVFISTFFNYKNWADSIGNYANPDSGTEAIMQFENIAGFTVFIICFIVAFLICRPQINRSNETDTTTEIKE